MKRRSDKQNPKKPKKAVIYCRVSTREQEESGTSLESQEAACRDHARSLGYEVARVTHEAYSGADLANRDKLNQDIADIKAHRFDALICYSTDRLARSVIHLGIVAEWIEEAKAELVFVTEPLDRSLEGQMITMIKGYAGALEREKIKERCVRGKRTRALSGKIHRSGFELYGYQRDKEAGVRVIVEPEAAIVRQVFEWTAAGLGQRSIAIRLNAQGTPPPSENKLTYRDKRTPHWGRSQIARLLREPAYKGQHIAWRWESYKDGKTRKVRNRPDSDHLPLPDGTTPPIVSPDLWQRAQNAIAKNRGEVARNAFRKYLLRGRIFCSECGSRMYPSPERGRRVYRCSSRMKETGEGPCGGKRIPADDCEQFVWDRLTSAIQNPKLISAEVERRATRGPDPGLQERLEKARTELARIESSQQRTVRQCMLSHNEALWEQIEKATPAIERQKAELRDRITDMEMRLVAQQETRWGFKAISAYCRRVAKWLAACNFEGKQLALKAFAVRVAGTGRDWQVDLRIGPEVGDVPTIY